MSFSVITPELRLVLGLSAALLVAGLPAWRVAAAMAGGGRARDRPTWMTVAGAVALAAGHPQETPFRNERRSADVSNAEAGA